MRRLHGARAVLRHCSNFTRSLIYPMRMGVTPLMAAAGIDTRTSAGVLCPGPPDGVEARSMENMAIMPNAGANANARITAMSLAARITRASTMTGREGQTVLFFAAQSGRAPVVRFLLDHGADVNAMGDSGRALLIAARARPRRSFLDWISHRKR
jgi:ankyrin repeat protein